MWYAFCGSVLASEGAFEGKMEELCRELGERGRAPTTPSTILNADPEFRRSDGGALASHAGTASSTWRPTGATSGRAQRVRTLSLLVEAPPHLSGKKKVHAAVSTLSELCTHLRHTLGLPGLPSGAAGDVESGETIAIWMHDSEFGEDVEVTSLESFETDKLKIRLVLDPTPSSVTHTATTTAAIMDDGGASIAGAGEGSTQAAGPRLAELLVNDDSGGAPVRGVEMTHTS